MLSLHPSRSGDTPAQQLRDRKGFLDVDQYTGYNKVCTPDGWVRVGCLAHVRRYFFDALETEPEAAQQVMEMILAVYQVEYQAQERGILGTSAHLELRQGQAALLMSKLHDWLVERRGNYRPKSPMGKAIAYTYILVGSTPSQSTKVQSAARCSSMFSHEPDKSLTRAPCARHSISSTC